MSGIQPHSLPTRKGNWVIFAANSWMAETIDQQLKLSGIAHKRLQGCFDNIPEDSWIVHEDDWFNSCYWMALGERCVLVLGEPDPESCMQRKAYIAPATRLGIYRPHRRFAGWFAWVTKEYALGQPASTYDPEDSRYWVVSAEPQQAYRVPVPNIKLGTYNWNAKDMAGRELVA